MKKRVFPRLVLALFLSLSAFVLVSAMQFARHGTFSLQIGAMTVSGRYYVGEPAYPEAYGPNGWMRLDGGASVVFAGLEFRLADFGEGGFFVVDSENVRRPAFPEYVFTDETTAIFALDSGVEISFTSRIPETLHGATPAQAAMPELRISGSFPEGIGAVDIPFRPRRSTVAWDNARGILGVTYDGVRYRFSRHSGELIEGRLVLAAGNPTIFYRVVPDVIVNNPADFVVPGTENAREFSQWLAAWTDRSFELWRNNLPADVAQDNVIALGAEALRRGVYGVAMSAVPAAFGHSPRRTWESSVFRLDGRVGVWEQGVRELVDTEERKVGLVGELLARRDYGGLFAENNLIEFLAVRGHNALVDGLVAAAWNMDLSAVTLRTSAGILESYADTGRFRPGAGNPFEPLAARARQIVADGLRQNGDQVLVFASNGQANVELNLRLGRALREWGDRTGNDEWAGLGRSLIFSVISLGDLFPGGQPGSVPALLVSDANGNQTASAERIGSASLFRILDENEFLPRAMATGVDGVWAWTAARSVNLTQTANAMDIRVDFPVGQTHFVMLRNVRPFAQLQVHGQNVPRNASFENSNVSGWYYFADEQTLVVKIQHRVNSELVRVVFTAPPPPPVIVATPPPAVQPQPPPPPVAPVPPVEEPPAEEPAAQPTIRVRPPTWNPFLQGQPLGEQEDDS